MGETPRGLRLLIVCYVHPPEIAPAGVMTRELAEHWVAQGHQATALTGFPNHPHGVVFAGYRKRLRQWQQRGPLGVLRVWHTTSPNRSTWPRLAFYASFAVSSLLNGLMTGKQDLVFGLSTPVVGGLACLLLARLKRARFVYAIWDVYPEAAITLGVMRPGRIADLLRWTDTWVCRRADKVAVPSEGLRRILTARGLPEDKMEVLPVWVDADEIRPLPRVTAWRREQGIDERSFVVLYAGTVGLISGAQFVVEAARTLAETDPDVLFLFVGEGLARDEVEQAAAGLALPNVRMLPFQPRERLAEVQATADVSLVTLLPGQGKTSVPSKVLAYMAAARPVIAGVEDDTDTAAWIRAADAGVVTRPLDPQALATAIRRLKDNDLERRRLGGNGRSYLLQHHDRPVALARYLGALQRLCGTGGP